MTGTARFLGKRWLISFLGICLLSFLIWFLGVLYQPLEPQYHRVLLILLVFIAWAGVRAWLSGRARKQNTAILSAVSENADSALSPEEKASRQEIDLLRERLQKAMAILKKSRLGGGYFGQQYLYQLPWYVVIGPSGAGKTTLLRNSDLRFPLADVFGRDAIKGEGGTRNCDWWFTDEAVLLDTAGRYVAQDSNRTVDKAAWLGFLDLLKKYRSRRPINGVIVAVSIKELLENDPERNRSQADSIRQRIEELHERLGIQFPIYLIVTKCDQLTGFTEYFDDLDREQRAQVWGMTFPYLDSAEKPVSELFAQEFGLLVKQLQNQLIEKLEKERGLARRNHLYTFPQQFASLNELIKAFVDDIFQKSPYMRPVMVRGVYFTSATQSGSPLDRILASLAHNFGLEQQHGQLLSGQGKSFFINRLLRNVIFAESGLAGVNRRQERAWAWLQRGALVSTGVLAAVIALAWFNSYVKNRDYIKRVADQAQAIEQSLNKLTAVQPELLETLPALERTRAMPGGYDDQFKSSVWPLHFGLYQGDDLGREGVRLYQKMLRELFLPALMTRLETRIRTGADNFNDLYQALKVYLMLTDQDHYQPEAIRADIVRDWENTLPPDIVSAGQRQALRDHLDALLAFGVNPLPRPMDRELVADARATLGRQAVEEILYARLVSQPNATEAADFTVSEASGDDAVLALASKSNRPLNKGVPGLYTCVGYRDVFLKNIDGVLDQYADENWVMAPNRQTRLTEADAASLRTKIIRLYLADYIENWDDLLNDIRIKPFSSQAQMVQVLAKISSPDSPLKRFLEAVDGETGMNCLSSAGRSAIDKAGDKLSAAQKTLGEILNRQSDAGETDAGEVFADAVRAHFKNLHDYVQNANQASSLKGSLMALNELYIHLRANGGNPEPSQMKEIDQVIEKLKVDGGHSPLPVKDMIEKTADAGRKVLADGVRAYLNDAWRSSVLSFCEQAIQGRYPIAGSPRDISFEDFSRFFGPNGMMDRFFTDYLAASVDKTEKNWKWNARVQNEGEGVSALALKQFQIADAVKNTFFSLGKTSPSFNFVLKPVSMSKDISQIIVDVDGQKLSYEFGPVTPVPMKWPGPKNTGLIRIQLFPIRGKSGVEKTGPWALLRLFDESNLSKTADPAIFILTFNIQGREAKFELRAGSAINPFQLSDFQSFQCLQNL